MKVFPKERERRCDWEFDEFHTEETQKLQTVYGNVSVTAQFRSFVSILFALLVWTDSCIKLINGVEIKIFSLLIGVKFKSSNVTGPLKSAVQTQTVGFINARAFILDFNPRLKQQHLIEWIVCSYIIICNQDMEPFVMHFCRERSESASRLLTLPDYVMPFK